MSVVHYASPISADVPQPVSRRVVWSVSIFCAIVGVVCTMLILFLYFGAHRGFASVLARIVPVPAAVVDGRVVWYSEVSERANALERISGVPSGEAMHRALLLSERYAVVKNLSDELRVTPEPFHAGESSLPPLYQAVLRRESRLEAAVFLSERLQSASRSKIEAIQLKLQQGIGFADLATEYSEGDAAVFGGDIGYVNPSMLPEELQTTAKTLAAGETSSIVETPYGFWLAKAEDVIESEGEERLILLRVIEIKKDLLGDVVDAELRRVRVREFLR